MANAIHLENRLPDIALSRVEFIVELTITQEFTLAIIPAHK
jgi:hypothetical protein